MDMTLHLLAREDLETVRQWRNSPEVSRYMYTDQLISAEEQVAWFARISQDATKRYWLIRYGERPIGLVNIAEISPAHRRCNWGFYFGVADLRGLGLASKVEFNVLRYVFDHLGLNKLYCEVFDWNENVIALHSKFGFRREGFFREHIVKDGKPQNIVCMGVLARDWKVIRSYYVEKLYGGEENLPVIP
ncbi:MAG: UDP-4-amino-4,6-dideoxy-N-acetyl-beta-L-altrosamine N-acetyltransferase [Bacteroidota bacterium]